MQVVGLHAHAASDNHGHSDGKAEDLLYVWKLLVVIGGIYVFYLFENVLRLWNTVRGVSRDPWKLVKTALILF